ncbi:unnamed protein product [Rotaria socialis]|uniref:Kinesin light chain n=2 Tax=Rotaria socialis TaxID=392032 RepID=A0A818WD12_9BILA|nr:unnamed protein product [Rotaria socialis]CAF4506427.1 unnamed protein product [Rotaria socialis]
MNQSTKDKDPKRGTIEYIEHGYYEEGLSMLNKCLETQKRSLPDDHPSLVATYNHITLGLSKLERYSEAFDIGMKALNIATKQLGDEHEQTCYLRAMLQMIADQMEPHPQDKFRMMPIKRGRLFILSLSFIKICGAIRRNDKKTKNDV